MAIETFVRAATEGRRARAEAMLAAEPELERDPWVKLVLGREWDGDPNAAGGPLGWAPLVYACHSCFETTALARALLERGADPNGFFVNEYGKMSALYGAAGMRHDPELTRALLEAGANPDDGESVYHSTEAESAECLRILLEHGAQTADTNALAHALDDERARARPAAARARRRPERGPSSRTPSGGVEVPETIELLVSHGADVDRPGGETWRGDVPLRTPYQHAVLRGRDDVAELLARLGASTDVDPADAAVASIARGERPTMPLPETLDPDAQEVIVLSAQSGKLDLVLDLVGPGFRGVVGGSPAGTLLHHAAWIGSVQTRRAAARSAAPTRRRVPTSTRRSPGRRTARQTTTMPDRDHVGVAERLVAAGA